MVVVRARRRARAFALAPAAAGGVVAVHGCGGCGCRSVGWWETTFRCGSKKVGGMKLSPERSTSAKTSGFAGAERGVEEGGQAVRYIATSRAHKEPGHSPIRWVWMKAIVASILQSK